MKHLEVGLGRQLGQNLVNQKTFVTSDMFPQKAYRPEGSVLDLGKVRLMGFELPTWRDALKRFLVLV